MLTSYLKIAWRSLFRNRSFSLTNILGLTIGITCTLLIFLWVQDELAFDGFHENRDNTYRLMAHRKFNNEVITDENMVLPLASEIAAKLPEIKHAVVTTSRESHVLAVGESQLRRNGYTTTPDFFRVFTWTFTKGNAIAPLADAQSLVLTASTAKALFGDTDPIGKTVRVDDSYDLRVTAVTADPPGNSSLQFDYINAFNFDNERVRRNMNEWVNSSWNVYIQTAPGTDMAALDKKIADIKYAHTPGDKKTSTYFSFPMSKWRLYADFRDGHNVGGMIEYVRLFTIIALIIVLIACVNFMNLSTARSEKRAREVGVRKTLGSGRRELIWQFFTESMLMTLIAFVLSVLLVYLLLPAFNTLVDKQLSLRLATSLFWLQSLGIILFTGLVAGSYPALYFSSFNPIKVLKGNWSAGRKAVLPRHVLVVIQFVISIVLVSATIIVYRQISHIRDRDTGYNPNNLLLIPMSEGINRNYDVIKQELVGTGKVAAVTRTLSPITDIWWRSPGPDYAGKPADQDIIFAGENTDLDFARTMGIRMLEGTDFTGFPSDSSSMLLNKAAVDAMGLKNPVGMEMRYGKSYRVIGVTDNVIMGSPFEPVSPMMIFFRKGGNHSVSVRLQANATLRESIAAIEAVFRKHNPAAPFEYRFADQEFNRKFITEERISSITRIFAGLAILICCMGLAGLASFTIENRIREIGIRKVLGATVQQILMLISAEFIRLVAIAFLVAIPIAWWLMHNWLQRYALHVNISIWLFVVVGILILVMTIVVVSANTLRAAMRNPVKSLRSE